METHTYRYLSHMMDQLDEERKYAYRGCRKDNTDPDTDPEIECMNNFAQKVYNEMERRRENNVEESDDWCDAEENDDEWCCKCKKCTSALLIQHWWRDCPRCEGCGFIQHPTGCKFCKHDAQTCPECIEDDRVPHRDLLLEWQLCTYEKVVGKGLPYNSYYDPRCPCCRG